MTKILIVDDDENIRLLYKEEFEGDGYQVLLAASAEEALEKSKKDKPDIISLDIKMPETDGIEYMRKLREYKSDIPVVLCSAYPRYRNDSGVLGSDAYVVKSADLTELKNTIKKCLCHKQDDLVPFN